MPVVVVAFNLQIYRNYVFACELLEIGISSLSLNVEHVSANNVISLLP